MRRGALAVALVATACSASTPEPVAAPPPAAAPPPLAPAPVPVAPAAPEPAPPVERGPAANAAAYEEASAFTAAEVKKVVRQHFDRVGKCYEKGLSRDPDMKGSIDVRLTISKDGRVVGAIAKKDSPGPARPSHGEVLTDREVVTCVEQVFESLKFAPTGQGMVNLVYPVHLRTE